MAALRSTASSWLETRATPRSVESLAERVAVEWGGIDVWVNNAARLMVRPVVETSDDDWHGLLRANLHGYFYGCRAASRRMVSAGSGSIVNVTSVARSQGIPEPRRLCRREGRDRGVDEDARGRARAARRHGQRGRSGRDGHAAERPRLHGRGAAHLRGADPARAHRHGGGGRRDGRCSSRPTPPATSPARSSWSTAASPSTEPSAMHRTEVLVDGLDHPEGVAWDPASRRSLGGRRGRPALSRRRRRPHVGARRRAHPASCSASPSTAEGASRSAAARRSVSTTAR